MKVVNPIIKTIPDNKNSLQSLHDNVNLELNAEEYDLIKNYPIVYLHSWSKGGKFEVYVGESNNFFNRTEQHYHKMNEKRTWQSNLKSKNADLTVIAHSYFNKSLTLDIENKLIKYLSSSYNIARVYNARGNPQNKYFPCQEFETIFNNIWNRLREHNNSLFLPEDEIVNSALYKASPLHKLNDEQLNAKYQIIEKIRECLYKPDEHQLILIQGNSGTGKSVLISNILYELLTSFNKYTVDEKHDMVLDNLEYALIVKQNEQLKVYEEIVKKLDLDKDQKQIVFNPTNYINQFLDKKRSLKKRDKKYDVTLVDEAHLLLTRNNQSFNGQNQLKEIMKYSKITVIVFDEFQIMNAEQYLDKSEINNYIKIAQDNNSFIKLKKQMRIVADESILDWLDTFIYEQQIKPLAKQRGNYEVKIFDSPSELDQAIRLKAQNPETSLSRLIASYDWPYSGSSCPTKEKYWEVKIGSWHKPWNNEIGRHATLKEKRRINGLAWTEQPHTINEVGSIYTIHGFDLNFAGVIIGPSVKFRNGKVVFDPTESCNDRATQKRTLSDGSKKSFAEEFLKHELGILLSRGVNGLYIFACDKELQEQLKKCINF